MTTTPKPTRKPALTLTSCNFHIDPDCLGRALIAVRSTTAKLDGHEAFIRADRVLEARSLDEALALWGWRPSPAGGLALDPQKYVDTAPLAYYVDAFGSGSMVAYLRSALSAHDRLFDGVAPYVTEGSLVVVEDYFGKRRSWRFDRESVSIEIATTPCEIDRPSEEKDPGSPGALPTAGRESQPEVWRVVAPKYLAFDASTLRICEDQHDNALRTVRCSADKFLHVFAIAEAQEIIDSRALSDAVSIWGWELHEDGGLAVDAHGPALPWDPAEERGDFLIKMHLGMLLEEQNVLFEALAPYAEPGSIVLATDCLGQRHVWKFDARSVSYETASPAGVDDEW